MKAFGFETAQINHAINASDDYETQEGLLYKTFFDPVSNGIKLAWCVPRGSAKSAKVLGGTHPLSVRNELITWFHSSEVWRFQSPLDATLGKMIRNCTWPTMVKDTEAFIGRVWSAEN